MIGGGIKVTSKVLLKVTAPDEQFPTDPNFWLLQSIVGGSNVKLGTETGWGETEGFKVVQMARIRIIYGGSPSMRLTMAFIFQTTKSLIGGGRLQVVTPEVYELSCRKEEGF